MCNDDPKKERNDTYPTWNRAFGPIQKKQSTIRNAKTIGMELMNLPIPTNSNDYHDLLHTPGKKNDKTKMMTVAFRRSQRTKKTKRKKSKDKEMRRKKR